MNRPSRNARLQNDMEVVSVVCNFLGISKVFIVSFSNMESGMSHFFRFQLFLLANMVLEATGDTTTTRKVLSSPNPKSIRPGKIFPQTFLAERVLTLIVRLLSISPGMLVTALGPGYVSLAT